MNVVDASGLASTLVDCLKRCATDQVGITTLLGIVSVILGQPWIGTRGKFADATSGTSIASKYLSKLFPQRLPVPLPAPTISRKKFLKKLLARSPVLGRVLGRWVPIIGWGLLAYDAAKILLCC